jgi:hypothetical protein
VAAVVPKLLVNGTVYSPATHFIDVLRGQFSRRVPNTYDTLLGIQERRLNVYNSASTLRVSALRSIGAFPTEFWLDYLDHTVFHTLFVKGYSIFVRAQTLFVKRTGNPIDRLLYRIWLLRYSRKLRSLCTDKQVWRETALQALVLRVPEPERPSKN